MWRPVYILSLQMMLHLYGCSLVGHLLWFKFHISRELLCHSIVSPGFAVWDMRYCPTWPQAVAFVVRRARLCSSQTQIEKELVNENEVTEASVTATMSAHFYVSGRPFLLTQTTIINPHLLVNNFLDSEIPIHLLFVIQSLIKCRHLLRSILPTAHGPGTRSIRDTELP